METTRKVDQVPVRQYWIDAAKAICISLIVFYHQCGEYFPGTVRLLSSIPVPVFVFLAGYQLSRRALSLSVRDFFNRNCMRIVVVFLSLGVLTYLPWLLKNQVSPSPAYVAIGPLLPLFGLVYGASGPQEWITHNVALWFLSFMASILFVYYAVYRLAKTPQRTAMASLAIYGIGVLIVQSLPVRLPWNIDLAMVGLPFFAFGYLAKVYRLDLLLARRPVAAALLLPVVAINYLSVPHPSHIDLNVGQIGQPVLLLLDGFTGILIAMIVTLHLPRLQILEVVGRNALLIFALHSLTGIVFNMGLSALFGAEAGPAHGLMLVVVADVLFNNAACILLGVPIRKYLPWVLGRRRRSSSGAGEFSVA